MNNEISELLKKYPELIRVYRGSYDAELAAEFIKLYDRVAKADERIAALEAKQ